jgi:hypothetical protein
MQVTIDTRHDTLEEALAVIQLAFAHGKNQGAAKGIAESTGQVRRRKGGRSAGGRGSRRAVSADNNTVGAPATIDGSASQAAAEAGVPAAAVVEAAPRRTRATPRKAPTKTTAAKKGASKKAPTKKAAVETAAAKTAAVKKAPASRSATKRAPASKSAASRSTAGSNTAAGQAEAVRAWARDQGMQVKTAGRMPAAVITAYNEAHS